MSTQSPFTPAMGTVERHPYVGDGDLIVSTCAHGDYHNVFKGASERRGEKALAAHHTAKHTTASHPQGDKP